MSSVLIDWLQKNYSKFEIFKCWTKALSAEYVGFYQVYENSEIST